MAETNPEFPINQKLLEDATHAKEEWRVIRDRIAKIDENKSKVSPVVYERVHRDYSSRLKEVSAALMKKKEAVDRELGILRETRGKISSQLEERRHKLEELKFRNTLGEFGEDEYQSASKVEQDKISKFETILAAIDNNITRYGSIFEGEDKLFEGDEGEAGAPKHHKKPAIPPRAEVEPATDSQGFVADEELEKDYFASQSDFEQTNPEIVPEESATSRQAQSLATPRAAHKKQPRLVIINGEETGTAFMLKSTTSMGRAESNTVPLKDAKISRQHAQIQKQGNEYVIVDLNSSNGTYVNGQRIEEHVLSNGDEIQIGDFILQFQV